MSRWKGHRPNAVEGTRSVFNQRRRKKYQRIKRAELADARRREEREAWRIEQENLT